MAKQVRSYDPEPLAQVPRKRLDCPCVAHQSVEQQPGRSSMIAVLVVADRAVRGGQVGIARSDLKGSGAAVAGTRER